MDRQLSAPHYIHLTTLLTNVTNSNQYSCLTLCCGHDNGMRYLMRFYIQRIKRLK